MNRKLIIHLFFLFSLPRGREILNFLTLFSHPGPRVMEKLLAKKLVEAH